MRGLCFRELKEHWGSCFRSGQSYSDRAGGGGDSYLLSRLLRLQKVSTGPSAVSETTSFQQSAAMVLDREVKSDDEPSCQDDHFGGKKKVVELEWRFCFLRMLKGKKKEKRENSGRRDILFCICQKNVVPDLC